MLPGEIGFMDLIGFCNAFGRKIGQKFSSLENLLSFQVYNIYNFYICARTFYTNRKPFISYTEMEKENSSFKSFVEGCIKCNFVGSKDVIFLNCSFGKCRQLFS